VELKKEHDQKHDAGMMHFDATECTSCLPGAVMESDLDILANTAAVDLIQCASHLAFDSYSALTSSFVICSAKQIFNRHGTGGGGLH